MRDVSRIALLAAAASLPLLSWSVRAADPAAAAFSYTAAQGERGATLYAAHCATCHGASLEGYDVAPPLSGSAFLPNWTGQPVGALVTRIRTTMPADDPGSLGVAASTDLAAFILGSNGYPAGDHELPADVRQQGQITLAAPAN